MKGENIIYDHLMYSGINYIITGSPYILYAIVALYLFVLPIWLYSKNGVFGNVWTRENGFKSHLPKGLKKKVFASVPCKRHFLLLRLQLYENDLASGNTPEHLQTEGCFF